MIHIGMDPYLIDIGSFQITWHGFFAFVGVLVAVWLTGRWARTRETLGSDVVYATAIWAIAGGIIGARALHVIDFWGYYMANPGQIVAVWNGGIALLGSILGGFAGAVIYLAWTVLRVRKASTLAITVITAIFVPPIALMYAQTKKWSIVGRLADITAPALLISHTIGRIGDIINGEHCATLTNLPWSFVYTHPASPARFCQGFIPTFPMHPAIAYEMLWNIVVLSVIWVLHGRLRPAGMLFMIYLVLYSVGRFAFSFLRTDGNILVAGLSEAHFVTLGIIILIVPWVVSKAQWVRRKETPGEELAK